MRAAKWTLIIAGSLLLLLVATGFLLTSVVDPNRYKGKVEAIVGDLAGRPLVIEGNLELTWYPWLGGRTGAAHLSNRPGVSGPPVIEWESVAVAAKVVPLLKGQVVVDRIRLQSPHFRLHRDAQGHGNWEDLGPRTARPSLAPNRPSSRPKQPPPEIAGLEVHAGTVEYVDEGSGLEINLSSVELDVGAWRAGETLPIHGRFLVHERSLPPSGVWVQVDTPALSVRPEPLNVTAAKLAIKVADAVIEGTFTYDQTADGRVSADGTVAAHAPSVRKLAGDLALNQTLPHDPTTLGPLELTTHWSYTDGSLAAKPLTLKLDGITFKGWVERGAPPKSGWRFELHGDRIDLGRYVNLDTTSKKPFELQMLRSVDANGSLIFDEAQLAGAHMSDVRLRFETPDRRTGGAGQGVVQGPPEANQ